MVNSKVQYHWCPTTIIDKSGDHTSSLAYNIVNDGIAINTKITLGNIVHIISKALLCDVELIIKNFKLLADLYKFLDILKKPKFKLKFFKISKFKLKFFKISKFILDFFKNSLKLKLYTLSKIYSPDTSFLTSFFFLVIYNIRISITIYKCWIYWEKTIKHKN